MERRKYGNLDRKVTKTKRNYARNGERIEKGEKDKNERVTRKRR
jgi:hypothetical protein